AEGVVNSAVGAGVTTANQFSAMVSLCFNIGATNYRASSVLSEHLATHTQNAAAAFLLWNKAHIHGVLQPVAGLTARRTAERDLYLS
ncbi:MAG TPA: glycoside hydrolase family protein, partial [Rhodopila sp.]|nr:glycoside hydrolase family protein [Rhodopila sp.]